MTAARSVATQGRGRGSDPALSSKAMAARRSMHSQGQPRRLARRQWLSYAAASEGMLLHKCKLQYQEHACETRHISLLSPATAERLRYPRPRRPGLARYMPGRMGDSVAGQLVDNLTRKGGAPPRS